MMVKNLIIHGNLKMGSDVHLFNLPPIKTCTPTDWCIHGRDGKPRCYALRNNFLFDNVKRGAEERYIASQEEDFVARMIDEIQRAGIVYFRFHSSGDFYSQDYVEKVFEIAENCPETKFRTTTRRRDLAKPLRKLNSLPNMIVRESLDGERPRPIMGLPFTALSYMDIVREKKTYSCPDDCKNCGYHCWKDRCSIRFEEF